LEIVCNVQTDFSVIFVIQIFIWQNKNYAPLCRKATKYNIASFTIKTVVIQARYCAMNVTKDIICLIL
jgi:hypothetical protein